MDRGMALAVVARELKLRRYKPDCWHRAQQHVELTGGRIESVYARLRMTQLQSSDCAPILSADVDRGLRLRWHESVIEAAALFSVLLVVMLVTARLVLA